MKQMVNICKCHTNLDYKRPLYYAEKLEFYNVRNGNLQNHFKQRNDRI